MFSSKADNSDVFLPRRPDDSVLIHSQQDKNVAFALLCEPR